MTVPDYTLHYDEPPPHVPSGHKRSKLSDNLFEAAKVPGEWRRIVTYTSSNTAGTVVSDPHSGKRAAFRPPGTLGVQVRSYRR